MTVIERILGEAKEMGATDVHLTGGAFPFARINGKLQSFGYEKVSGDDTLDFLLKYMSEVRREGYEERGECVFSLSLDGVGRIRVNAYKQLETVALNFRLLKSENELSEQALNMPKAVWECSEKPRGLVLVAGAGGSGKTTTLAAFINHINESRAVHIVTLERPVEYVHSHKKSFVSQREIGTDCNDFGAAIVDAQKADADVLLVSELRDAVVTDAALTAAESGVLVFVEVNAGSALGALEQLIDSFELNKQKRVRERLMNALEAIIFQQHLPDENGKLRVVYKVVGTKKPVA